MIKIQKAPETMTSRQRVKNTFAFEKTDRVPIGYEANPGIDGRLRTALGVHNHEELWDALGVDVRPIGADYTGPILHPTPPDRRVDQLEGCIMRWVTHQTGGYWDFCDFPLKDASDEAFEKFPIPDPDHFNYDAALAQAKSYGGQYALYVGSPGVPDILNSNGRIMGVEDVLVHLLLDDEAAVDFMRRRAQFQLGHMERLLDKCHDEIDFVWLGEDLGTQHTPIISLELYRNKLAPTHRMFVELAESYGLPTLVHTCGASSWVYEDFIAMGVKGVDTLQPEATNMSPAYLAEHFGGRLNFRGCISTAGPLAIGTQEDVRECCRETLETMMAVRGYHFAPTHMIQDNTPTENVIAMYQAAHTFGRYDV